MKLIINTALDPHFCAVFSEQDKLLESFFWEDRVNDSKNIYNFLSSNNVSEISFCGGITGPGGFASLRSTGAVLTSISVAQKIKIHQVSAEDFLFQLLGTTDFLLNSFGDYVWVFNGKEISRKKTVEIDKRRNWITNFLPIKKKKEFPISRVIDIKNIEKSLLSVLKKENPRNFFIPHYEFSPV